MSFSVEDELATCVEPIGGIRVTNLLGRAPSHKNADFFFDDANVIAELKCLDEDKIHDDKIIEKVSSLYLHELNADRAPVIIFGEVRMTTSGFTPAFTDEIMSLYRIPIERRVRKANRQIAETKQALNRPDASGLLLVANNNHTALDPWHAWKLLDDIVKKPDYEHIDAAVLFAGNLGAKFPEHQERVEYWLEFHRESNHPVDIKFLETLRISWFQQLGKMFGSNVVTLAMANPLELAKLESG